MIGKAERFIDMQKEKEMWAEYIAGEHKGLDRLREFEKTFRRNKVWEIFNRVMKFCKKQIAKSL